MSRQPTDWENEWSGFDPQPQRPSRKKLWIILFFVLLVLIACAGGAWFAWQQTAQWLAPTTVVLPVPTAVVESDSSEPTGSNTATPLVIAPTVTLPFVSEVGSTVTAVAPPPQLLIDGDLGEWGAVAGVESPFRVYNAASWDGTDDVTAVWQLAADDNFLYLAVAVTDDVHVQTQTGATIFRGDSISLQFDTDRNGDFGPQLNSDDFQIDLSAGDFEILPPSAVRYRGQSNGSIPVAPGHNIQVTAQKTAAGYQIEAAIPWSDLAFNPTAGQMLGLALNVNDNDKPGTAVQEVMKSHVITRQFGDPTTWGTLTIDD